MRLLKVFLTSILMGATFMGYADGIGSGQLPKVNAFTITDGEQHIAATDQGLFFSLDQGHTWNAYEEYRLPATMVSQTEQGLVYAFVVTKGLLQLDNDANKWRIINNEFGSQILRQLSNSTEKPTRMVVLNQYGKFLVSENDGTEWHQLQGPYKAGSPAEKRGQILYTQKCQSCHGKNGVGETYSIQALTDKEYIMAPALDASAHAWHHLDNALEKTILEGSPRTPRMMAWKKAGVSKADASDLVSYIKSLWTQRELDCQGPKHMQCM